MNIYQFSPHVFANLPEFETSKAQLAKNETAIELLGEVIQAYNLGSKVGVSLLHKHFNLYEDELLVRNFERNTFQIKAESGVEDKSLPYMWTFSKLRSRDDLSVYPVEFIGKTDKTAQFVDISDLVMGNEAFLEDFSKQLKELNVENIFGLSLIPHGLFDIPPKHTLFERDDIPNRRLIISVEPLSKIESIKTTRTLFLFPTVDSPKLGIICALHCAAHCGVHCGLHCGLHCGAHCAVHCGIHL